MKKIPSKNYIILVLMLTLVVIITFSCRNFYNNNLKSTSKMYKYARHMSGEDLKVYLYEAPSLVIYIADKYDLNNEIIEEKLKRKIISNNLYNNFIYIDYREFNSAFLNYFNSQYHTSFNVSHLPTVIIYDDGVITDIYYSIDDTNIGNINLEGVK